MHGFELAQAAADTVALAEALAAVEPAAARDEQRRYAMPTMAPQEAGRAVVAGDDQHVGVEGSDAWHGTVQLFDPLHFGREVAIFAGAVGVLEVDEEEVEL